MLGLLFAGSIYFIIFCLLLKVYNKFTLGLCKTNVCLVGKTAIVTGGVSGLGYEVSLNLASRACKVIILDVANGEETVRKIRKITNNEQIYYKYIDLGSLKSTRQCADDILQNESKLDILVNNAGMVGSQFAVSEDGISKVVHVNHIGGFLLTHLLLPLLKQTPKSRLVFVSSAFAYLNNYTAPTDLNAVPDASTPFWQKTYQYGNSKLCNLIASDMFARKLKGSGISCNAVYPGFVRTKIFDGYKDGGKDDTILDRVHDAALRFLYLFSKSPWEGAQVILHCALDESLDGVSGKYLFDCDDFWKPTAARTRKITEHVWKESERLAQLLPHEKL